MSEQFTLSGYELSTKYKLLWDLVMSGKRIPAYQDAFLVNKNQPIESKCIVEFRLDNNGYVFVFNSDGTGIGTTTFERFQIMCVNNNVQFLLPNNI